MSNFLKRLSETVGFYSLNRRTEVRVYVEDGRLMVAIPDCCNDPVDVGVSMRADELEDALSQFVHSDEGGYRQNLYVSGMELVDDGQVALYGAAVNAFL